jgi:DNA sulfur modification protein DndE
MPVVEKEVKIKVLLDAPEWSMNGPGTSNGLLVISGQPGSGKSQLALDLLAQLSNNGVRFVFFDLKGELEDDPNNPQQRRNRTQFLQQTGARYVRLIQHDLPINPLYRHPNPTQNAQVAYEIANLIRCFAPQLGAKQERNICDAYQRLPTPDFTSLSLELESSGATGVDLAIVQKIERFNLFASAQTGISPESWLTSSLVIDFKDFGNDSETKALAAALILNFLIKKLNQQLPVKNGIQPLKMVLFVDEAHLLLPKENKVGLLSSLARQGRSWGFPVWLASQDADKFLTTGTNETNFADLAECGVHFSPQTLSPADQKLILGGVIHQRFKKTEAALRLQGKLQTGVARQFWKDEGK